MSLLPQIFNSKLGKLLSSPGDKFSAEITKTGRQVVKITTDEIISPVKNSRGEFFASGKRVYLPIDADANGAYNIAKKGLWIIRRIQETPEGEMPKLKLTMTNKEWLKFAQENTL